MHDVINTDLSRWHAYSDAAEAGVPDERDLEAGADRVGVDDFVKADDGDDEEIVEHACRGAQGLAGGVASVSECPCSAESVYRKRRRRRSDDGANTMGTHSSFLLWYYAIAPVTRDKLPTLVCHLVCVVHSSCTWVSSGA